MLTRALLTFSLALAIATGSTSGDARAGKITFTSCSAFGDNGTAFASSSPSSFVLGNRCPQHGSFQISTPTPTSVGDKAYWSTTTPRTIEIVAAGATDQEVLIDPHIASNGYAATWFWHGGTQQIRPVASCCGGMDYGTGIYRSLPPSRYFGWQVTCIGACTDGAQLLDVRGIALQAIDNTPPTLAPAPGPNLWTATGEWVRGTWPLAAGAADDSGICDLTAQVGSTTFQGPQDTQPNQHSWTQCPSPAFITEQVDTTHLPDGAVALGLSANDAASPANVSTPSETAHVDNQPVSLTLSGPRDAPITAGTQYVSASATAGPSGVAGISCSVDGSPAQWYAGSGARIPIQGLGAHQVSCTAQNNAHTADGSPANSGTQTWQLTIRQPTESTVGFLSVVDRLRCTSRRERVTIPAHWATGEYQGKRVRVRVPAERRTLTVVRCRPQIVARRVRINGHWHVIRAIVFPHVVHVRSERVAYGQPAVVKGWLGTATGTALAGQTVDILTAPDDGSQHFTLATTTLTSAGGGWSAVLRPGPSRIVEAFYPGTSTTEPAFTVPARLTVPARVSLGLAPHQTHWGSSITIYGRVAGGHVPPAGELVVLWIGWRGGKTEIGHLYAARSGRFATRYTFLRGNGRETYRIWAESARESDYPYAPSRSTSVTITVSQR